jgi:hypothetical protein
MLCLFPNELFEQSLGSEQLHANGESIHRNLPIVIADPLGGPRIANLRKVDCGMHDPGLHRSFDQVCGKWLLNQTLPPALALLYVTTAKVYTKG